MKFLTGFIFFVIILFSCESPVEPEIDDNILYISHISDSSILLEWSMITASYSHLLERGTAPTYFSVIDTLPPGTESFVDSMLSTEETYHYKITRIKADNAGIYHSFSFVADSVQTVFPDIESIEIIRPSADSVVINWEHNYNFESGYQIDRIRIDGANDTWVELATLPPNSEQYIDLVSDENGFNPQANYVYRLKSFSQINESLPIEETTNSSFISPESFNIMVMEYYATNADVKLLWSYNLPGVDNFIVRKVENEEIVELETVENFLTLNLSLGVAYTFSLAAKVGDYISDFSNSQDIFLMQKGEIFVKGGTYEMGDLSDIGDIGDIDESPSHFVEISDFVMSQYEITNSEWNAIMNENTGEDSLPKTNVSWLSAIEFCNQKSIEKGFDVCYQIENEIVSWNFHANGYRLPTEAEWELAAGGGSLYINDRNIFSGCLNEENLQEYAIFDTIEVSRIGMKEPNSLDIYDLSGNVWEWCWDKSDSPDFEYYDFCFENEPITNPKGITLSDENAMRTIRGGSFLSQSQSLRNSNRTYAPKNEQHPARGFRTVRNAP